MRVPLHLLSDLWEQRQQALKLVILEEVSRVDLAFE